MPVSVLSEANSRSETAVTLSLPPSCPIKDLLKKVEAGTLYLLDEPPTYDNILSEDRRDNNIESHGSIATTEIASQGQINVDIPSDDGRYLVYSNNNDGIDLVGMLNIHQDTNTNNVNIQNVLSRLLEQIQQQDNNEDDSDD